MKTAIGLFNLRRFSFASRKRIGIFSIAILGIELMFCTTIFAQSTAPLIQQSNLNYLGAFSLPNTTWYGTSAFVYGGHGLMPYNDPSTGKRTLFIEGHAQYPGNVAQIEIPASFVKSTNWNSLPMATILQNFSDITDGKLSTVDPTNSNNPTFIYGILPYNGRLIVAASNVYSFSQNVSHGVSGLNLATQNDFKGFYTVNSEAPPRAVGGPMTLIPPEWRSAFGGPAFTSNFGISVVSATSAGPTLTVFNPDDVGVKNPIPGTTILFYPLSNPACGSVGCEATQNNVFNLTTGYGGIAFPTGSRSVLFIESQGTGPYCYGTAAECNDPYQPDVKGPHAPPYRYQISAYDANDLLAVKNGTKKIWEPKPYAVWPLSDLPINRAMIGGAGYDAETGRLFIATDYSNQPRIEVYQITVSGGTVTTLLPPTNVKVLQTP